MLRRDTNFMKNLLKSAPSSYELRKLRMIADYQICKGAGKVLFPQEEIEVTHSKKTCRIRHIYLNNQLIATLRPKDGVFALTPFGGALLLNGIPFINLPIIVAQNQIASYIREGRSLFCKHVVSISSEIRAGDEVLITDEDHNLIAVGRACLCADEIKNFTTGMAVKIRYGVPDNSLKN